jgi:hypothetical protein
MWQKRAHDLCSEMAQRGFLKAGKAHMFSITASPKKESPMSETIDARQRLTEYCRTTRTAPTDVFKKAGVDVQQGVRWLAGKGEISMTELAALDLVYGVRV